MRYSGQSTLSLEFKKYFCVKGGDTDSLNPPPQYMNETLKVIFKLKKLVQNIQRSFDQILNKEGMNLTNFG